MTPAIDKIAPTSEQLAWVEGRAANSTPSDRDVGDSDEFRARAGQLMSLAHWPKAKRFLGKYIETCIFRYAETEREWWSLTAWPDAVRINVGPQEALYM